ncbi:putative toxin-antitoxin system toxin component, PIN family [Lysobacter chinensis]|uniref:Toxin-antitoxin system toxin component, PIN family n=1 Tax=Marilutibacter chinensis TaxID=2912247 RepID=A0ABS9HW67_9GAMM|nr:putative toxin-antitoxin system toxin component, PIN family [Lysobacter chinensis]MCF7222424.1 putative toxin-antitoxin system toxin component, PIN family [Lysobacter chinensis]
MTLPAGPSRIVLDTNAWLDLLVFSDPRIDAIRAALDSGMLEAVTNAECREEWRRVLGYPLLALEPDRRLALIEAFDATAACLDTQPVEVPALPRCRDPDDQKFLELALAANARWLVSRDKALLKLDRHTRRGGLFAILVPEAWPDGKPAMSSGFRSRTDTTA